MYTSYPETPLKLPFFFCKQIKKTPLLRDVLQLMSDAQVPIKEVEVWVCGVGAQ